MADIAEFPNVVAFLRTLRGYPDVAVARSAQVAADEIEALRRAQSRHRKRLEGWLAALKTGRSEPLYIERDATLRALSDDE